MKRVAILQSNYIPWKGYFDIIAAVDEFILYDDVQFTKNDWRNRNRIKTPQGLTWLTIPVGPGIHRKICDISIASPRWRMTHWKTLVQNYRKASCFEMVATWLEPMYLRCTHANLSASNRAFIEAVCSYLSIKTKLSWSWDYSTGEGRTERLIDLCLKAGATEYVTGPAARSYLDVAAFAACGIAVTWVNYAGYPPYPQLWGPFEHQVSIVDLLFNCGRSAPRYMRHGSSEILQRYTSMEL
jgi:hypothetical protein